jgi:hypothetical protein
MYQITRNIRSLVVLAATAATLVGVGAAAHAATVSTLKAKGYTCKYVGYGFVRCTNGTNSYLCDSTGCKKESTAATSIQSTVESFTDRPTKDYRAFETNDRRVCQNACIAESDCAAWTYVEPGVQGPTGRCWLKYSVPVPRSSGVCTSGVKISTEPGLDRPGGDYKHFSISRYHTDGAKFCQTVCVGEAPRCRAWTYVKPGVQGSDAVCWLKDEVPSERSNDCCTSGVVGELPTT